MTFSKSTIAAFIRHCLGFLLLRRRSSAELSADAPEASTSGPYPLPEQAPLSSQTVAPQASVCVTDTGNDQPVFHDKPSVVFDHYEAEPAVVSVGEPVEHATALGVEEILLDGPEPVECAAE